MLIKEKNNVSYNVDLIKIYNDILLQEIEKNKKCNILLEFLEKQN